MRKIQLGNRPLFPPFGGWILYDLGNKSIGDPFLIIKTFNDFNLSKEDLIIFPSIIMDALSEIIESDYSQDFMNQMGIIRYIPIRKIQEGIEEIQFFFKDKESLENYLKEYDISKDELVLN